MDTPPKRSWQGIPENLREKWYAILGRPGGIDIEDPCPVCARPALHRYFSRHHPGPPTAEGQDLSRRGGGWTWCSACLTFEHWSGLIPDWWNDSIDLRGAPLTALPDALEDAVRFRDEH